VIKYLKNEVTRLKHGSDSTTILFSGDKPKHDMRRSRSTMGMSEDFN
jgi:hypothetical protein